MTQIALIHYIKYPYCNYPHEKNNSCLQEVKG